MQAGCEGWYGMRGLRAAGVVFDDGPLVIK